MNLLTEDEAKAKWCPLARATDLGNRPVTVNRQEASPDVDCMCIASACMAWRTGVFNHQRNLTPENRTPGVGYCGAFGRPDLGGQS